jgi:glycosyltransferase involved in cell wall biosynthesis
MKRSVAAVGDTADISCWSGIPFHFLQAARSSGFVSDPWRVDLREVFLQRLLWNAGQVLTGRGGGFQYSGWFLDLLEARVPQELMGSEIISFNQHFPRAASVAAAGGLLNHYVDAPFAALASGRGLNLRLPTAIVSRAITLECENYKASQRVITMARWAEAVLVRECGVPSSKVHVILPGANLNLPVDWEFSVPLGRAGIERDFTLGFVGKDWQRKGLPLLVKVRDDLVRRGWRVRVLAIGEAPTELRQNVGVDFAGFIHKAHNVSKFLSFLTACDIGCLFSEREAFGISTLEFLRAGVPVAGYAHEGPADTLPPDAGFRFALGENVDTIADRFEVYLNDEVAQTEFRKNAQRWSKLVTWSRCIQEFQELWITGYVKNPVQPWRGLNSYL